MTDNVNHPKHYTDLPGLEVIDIIRASLTPSQFIGYCIGNTIKYRMRAGKKGAAAECLAKAEVYAKWAREAASTSPFIDRPLPSKPDWPVDDSRIDAIGQNGPTGEHYQAWRKCTGFPPEEALGSMVDARFEDGTAFFDVPCSSVSWGRATEWRPAK